MGEPLRNLDSDLVSLLSDCCIYLVAIDGQFTEREQAWVDWQFGDGTAQELIEKTGSIQWDNFYGDLAQTISVLGETEIAYLRTQAPGFFIDLLEVDEFGETEKQSLDELVKFINETIAENEKATTDDKIVSSGEPRVEAPTELAVADSDTEDWHVTQSASLPQQAAAEPVAPVAPAEPTATTPAELKVGTVVRAKWKDRFWGDGKIAKLNADGTYAVQYDDDDHVEVSVKRNLIRLPDEDQPNNYESTLFGTFCTWGCIIILVVPAFLAFLWLFDGCLDLMEEGTKGGKTKPMTPEEVMKLWKLKPKR